MNREDYKHQLQIAIIVQGINLAVNQFSDIDDDISIIFEAASIVAEKVTDLEFGGKNE